MLRTGGLVALLLAGCTASAPDAANQSNQAEAGNILTSAAPPGAALTLTRLDCGHDPGAEEQFQQPPLRAAKVGLHGEHGPEIRTCPGRVAEILDTHLVPAHAGYIHVEDEQDGQAANDIQRGNPLRAADTIDSKSCFSVHLRAPRQNDDAETKCADSTRPARRNARSQGTCWTGRRGVTICPSNRVKEF